MFFYATSIIPYSVELVDERKSKKQLKKPNMKRSERDVEHELVELCRGIRLISGRDTDGTVVEVFRRVLVKRGTPVGSTELSRDSRLNRITCIHHLKRLASMGILERDDGKYKLRGSSVEGVIDKMRENTLAMFEEMEQLAKKIDTELENEYGERTTEERKRPRAARAKK